MAGKKVKPIVIIYEVPHIPKIQQALLTLREELKKAGWQVVFNNPQPYTSDQVFKKAELCIFYDKSSTANAEKIVADYLAAKIDVMDYKEWQAVAGVMADKKKKAEAKAKAETGGGAPEAGKEKDNK